MNEDLYSILIFNIPVILLSIIQIFNLKFKKKILSVLTLIGYIILAVSVIMLYLILYTLGLLLGFSFDLTKNIFEKFLFNDNNMQFDLTGSMPSVINIFFVLLIIYILFLLIVNIINIIQIKKYLILTSLSLTLIPYFLIVYLIIF